MENLYCSFWKRGIFVKKNSKTIAKYFKYLEDKGLIKEGANENYYYLTTLDAMEANLVEY